MTEQPRDIVWLRETFTALDRVYFLGALADRGVKVRWERWRRTKTRLTVGKCWTHKDPPIIELNPILKRPDIPDYYVMFVLYHEQLHVHIGHDHDTAFQLAEKRFVHHAEALMWEQKHWDWMFTLEPPAKSA